MTQKEMDEVMAAVDFEVQKIMDEFMQLQMQGREYMQQEAEVEDGDIYSQVG